MRCTAFLRRRVHASIPGCLPCLAVTAVATPEERECACICVRVCGCVDVCVCVCACMRERACVSVYVGVYVKGKTWYRRGYFNSQP